MNRQRVRSITLIQKLSIALCVVLSASQLTSAATMDDDVPFFSGQNGMPNVMILFDNSDSMKNSPYKQKDGSVYKPSGWTDGLWTRGVTPTSDTDSDCTTGAPCIAGYDNSKHLVVDEHGNTKTELTLPGSNPPNLPGLFTPSSTITPEATSPDIEYYGTDCPAGIRCSDKIYDSSLDWSQLNATVMDQRFKNWKVRITEKSTGAVQERTLTNYDATNKYWTVSSPDLEYKQNKYYIYEIVVGKPGEVTSESAYQNRIYDRNFNWRSVINDRDFNFLYKSKNLEIIEGTNASESSTIKGRNVISGYWEVTSNFTASCDLTSKYRIKVDSSFVTGTLQTRRAYGADHPASKMYQAKEALKKFLLSDNIRSTYTNIHTGETKDRYKINVGFASFMQALVPRTKALYYRKIAAVPSTTTDYPAQFSYMFRINFNHSPDDKYLPTGCTDGVPPANIASLVNPGNWTKTYTNVANGGIIDRDYNSGCQKQTIRYQVTYTCSPTDSLPDQVQISADSLKSWKTNPPAGYTSTQVAGKDPDNNNQWGYTYYGWQYYDASNGTDPTDCSTYTPSDAGDWKYVTAAQSCHECRNHAAYSTTTPERVSYYQTKWLTTTGDLRQQNPSYREYITKNPAPDKAYMVTPNPGYVGGTYTVNFTPDPEPATGDGDYTLLTSDNEKATSVCTKLNDDGTCKSSSTILAANYPIADYSYFKYPGKNGSGGTPSTPDSNYPHGWSYKKTKLNPSWPKNFYKYRHRFDGSYTLTHFDNTDLFIYAKGGSYPSVWGDSTQRPVFDSDHPNDPVYYPALTGNDFSNYFGEDQVFFVNLPKYDDKMFNFGDDYEGSNVNRILNRINLAIKQQYNSGWTVNTMAPGNPGSLAVSAYSAETGNGTPIAATLRDARKYFETYIRQDPLSKESCRKNFIILLTDGTETTNEDPVEEAKKLWELQVDGIDTPVRTFVVGFGLGALEKAALNAIAAAGGPSGSSAYFAQNIDELVTILSKEIGDILTAGTFSRAKAGLPKSGGRTNDGLTVYNAFFDYPGWRGHLEAYDVYQKDEYDALGNLIAEAGHIKAPSALWTTGCSGTYPTLVTAGAPDAGCIIAEDNPNPDSSTRTIYTTVTVGGTTTREIFGTTAIDGSTEGNALKDALTKLIGPPPIPLDIDENGTPNEDDDAKAVIGYVHHPGYNGSKYLGTRTKEWPLADIYNSSPVVVSAPLDRGCIATGTTPDKSNPAEWNWENMTGYCQYNHTMKKRKAMIYFGTNGGMIEAITAGRTAVADDPATTENETVTAITGGKELWGFIPDFVLPRLHEFKTGHRFTMDLDVLAAEVDTSYNLTGTGWTTILMAGQRKGGSSYAALDVTDPDDPQSLWTFTDSNLGETWSRPSVARLEIDGIRTSVFIFGGGYSNNPNEGNRVYIVNASDGTILKEITVGGVNNNVPARLTTMRYLTNGTGQVIDYRTNAIDGTYGDNLGIDSDRRDFIEVAYFGDTDGNIWRLEGLNTDSGGSWNPKVVKLFQPDSSHTQPVYHMLTVVDRRVSSTCVKRLILAGTGDENNPIALKDGGGKPLLNYFFEIEEDTSGVDVTDESKLTWRLSFGKEFPRDKYGFLRKPDNSGRYQYAGKDILSSYIFILKKSVYDDGGGAPWDIDENDNLTYTYPIIPPASDGITVLVAEKGEYLFVDDKGDLYEKDTEDSLVIGDSDPDTIDYYTIDFSNWLLNKNGDFYDSATGTVIIPKAVVDTYLYDNDGYWIDTNSPPTRHHVDGIEKKIVRDIGEKMLTEPDGYGEQIYFMTYTPLGGCGEGQSYFYGVRASQCDLLHLTGGAGVLTHGPGTEIYPTTRKFRHSSQRKVGLGKGIANFTLGGKTAFIGQGGNLNPLPIPISQKRLRYWRQN